jgi:hypothetical protein
MSNDREDELIGMAGGDPALAALVRAALQHIRDDAGNSEDGQLREIARDVLEGRASLRYAAGSNAYRAAMLEAFQRLRRWREEVGDEQYQHYLEQTREQLRAMNENTVHRDD